MRVRVLGPLRVEHPDGASVAPRGDRPRDVLALLCTRRGRPLPAEVILSRVWEDEGRAFTPGIVHTVVARLRRQYGAGLVHTSGGGYLVPPGTWVDAEEFAGLAAAAHEARLDDRPADREALCRQALSLWLGSVAYEGVRDDLVRAERVRLQELHRRVRAELAACLLAHAGGPGGTAAPAAEALALAGDMLAANPVDETAAALYMRAAYRLGRQGDALRAFDTLRRRLREELGIDPGPAVRAVHAQVLAHAPGLAGAPAPAVHHGRRMPTLSSPTVGREQQTAEVLRAVAEGRRLVTVTGPGGVGKSRMLADIAAALAADTAVGYVTLSTREGQTAADLATSLAVISGTPLRGGDPVAALVRSVSSHEHLVLVDDAEWAADAAATLASAVLAGAPAVRLVIASRVPLGVVGERIVELTPLAVPDPAGPLPAVRSSPAVRLLLERLADRGLVSDPDPACWPEAALRTAAEAAERLDGLPLALELLAGAADTTPVENLLDLLASPLDLSSSERGREDRQRSLRQAIAWSVTRLDPFTRGVLARLAVFTGQFSLAAARAVVGYDESDVDRAVRRLAANHLLSVERVPGAVSFRLLRMVRELAREELAAAGQNDAARRRHQAWFAGLWRDAALSDALIAHVGEHYDDYIEAMTGALAMGRDDIAADLATTLYRRWLFVEATGPGLHWTTTLLQRPGITPQQRARLRIAHGAFAQELHLTATDRAILTATLADDPDWTLQLALVEAITSYGTGDLAAARHHLDRGVDVATAKAPHHLPEMIATRAVVDAAGGDRDVAIAGAHQALALIGHSISAVHHVTVVPKVALALLDAGRPGEALDLLERASSAATDRFGIAPTATTATNAGWAALALGRTDSAVHWFTRALAGPGAFTAHSSMGECALGLGAALTARDPPAAAVLLGLGSHLLSGEGQVLPPTLRRHVALAAGQVPPALPPTGWPADLAAARARQLAGDIRDSLSM